MEDEDPTSADATVLEGAASEMGEPDATVLDPTNPEDPDEPPEPETAEGG